jgi:hypothetical protein
MTAIGVVRGPSSVREQSWARRAPALRRATWVAEQLAFYMGYCPHRRERYLSCPRMMAVHCWLRRIRSTDAALPTQPEWV